MDQSEKRTTISCLVNAIPVDDNKTDDHQLSPELDEYAPRYLFLGGFYFKVIISRPDTSDLMNMRLNAILI